jgi:hypothetical protein
MMLGELEHLSSAVNIPYARLKCLAQSGHPDTLKQCPLSRVKRTSPFQSVMSAFDPKRTSASYPTLLVNQSRPLPVSWLNPLRSLSQVFGEQ